VRPLWLTETFPPQRGGMAESCDRLVRALRADGVAVDVVHLSDRHERLDVRPRRRGRDLLCPAGADAAHDLNLLWAHLRHEPAGWTHVVAFGGELPILAGPALAAWLGLPLVTLLRGNDFDAAVFNPRRRPALETAAGASARVVCVTREMAARAAALWPDVAIEAIGNGIDVAAFAATPADRVRAQTWRVPGRTHLGLIGQLKGKKGALLLLDALRRSGRADEVQLLLAGELAPELEEWLDAHAGTVHATLVSESERLALIPVYLACDWVAIPSFYDGMPNVLLEALALGIPVLASDAGGMPELVRDGENGVLFAAGDLEACRAALERALDTRLAFPAGRVPSHTAEAAAYRALLTACAPAPRSPTRTPARPPGPGPAIPAS
jgi:glycogen(starch) synthase